MSSIENHSSNRNEEEDDFSFALQLATGSMLHMAMQVAVELDVFAIIAKAGPAATMARNAEDGVSLSPIVLLVQDKVFIDSWCHVKDAILEGGIPFNKAHGMHAFEYPSRDDRFNKVFNRAMFNHTTIVMKKILETYRGFEELKSIVDVGGGIAKYHTIKGINLELQHVIEHAPSYPRVEHVGGNMFESVPTAEAIFMKWILHDWSDENCLNLLKNCYRALPDNGKVMVVEAIIPVEAETDAAAKGIFHTDVLMLTQNPGGKERTEMEFGQRRRLYCYEESVMCL